MSAGAIHGSFFEHWGGVGVLRCSECSGGRASAVMEDKGVGSIVLEEQGVASTGVKE